MSQLLSSLCLIGLLLPTLPVGAATRIWPGASPCNGTLQACIDASAHHDRVEVASNDVIDEDLNVGKAITLIAADGFRPQLAVGRNLSASAFQPSPPIQWTMHLEGFTLNGGYVVVFLGTAGDGHVAVRRMHVKGTDGMMWPPIHVRRTYSVAGVNSTYDIDSNRVEHARSLKDENRLFGGIDLIDYGPSYFTGTIRNNEVVALGAHAVGIHVLARFSANHVTKVHNNVVRGGRAHGSILVSQGQQNGPASSGATMQATIANNLVVAANDGQGRPRGIVIRAFHDNLQFAAVNNTVVGAEVGIDVLIADGILSGLGRVTNNLLAGNVSQLSIVNNASSGLISNDHNLLYGPVPPELTPGPGTIAGDPGLMGQFGNPRLRAGSAAIDAGNTAALQTVMADQGLPALDVDGGRRFKGGGADPAVDIGAFEFGDHSFAHVATAANSSGGVTQIDNPASNGLPAALVFATPRNDGTAASTIDPLAVDYLFGRWHLVNEDPAQAIPPGQRYGVFVPAPGRGLLVHQAVAAVTDGWFTRVDSQELDDKPDQIVLVGRNLDVGVTTANLHPIGTAYLEQGGVGSWHIGNLDQQPGGPMPEDIGFNIYTQQPSNSAFRVVATAANTGSGALMLRQPLLDDTPCAEVHVTEQYSGSPSVGGVGVGYDSVAGRWSLQGAEAMSIGREFHVLLDPGQIFECTDIVFADGSEP